MSKYILIKISDSSLAGQITDSQNEAIGFPKDISHKDLKWYPLIINSRPVINEATQVAERTEGIVNTDYIKGWTTRNKDQAELNQDAADIEADKQQQADSAVINIFGKIAFDMENRMRVQEGENTVTAAQYKAAVKAKL